MQETSFNTSQTEKRGATRRRMLLPANISPDGLGTTFDCVVRNISATGARVKVTAQLGIPRIFRFQFKEEGLDVKAEAIWRTDKEIGVSFLNS